MLPTRRTALWRRRCRPLALIASQASAAVGGNPAATTVTASSVGQENTRGQPAPGLGRWAGVGWGPDSGFPSNSLLGPGSNSTSVNLHGKQSASAVSSGESQNVEGHDSLDGTDLSARQKSTPRQIAGEQSILNPGKASSAVPMTAQMTAQLRSAIAQARIRIRAPRCRRWIKHAVNLSRATVIAGRIRACFGGRRCRDIDSAVSPSRSNGTVGQWPAANNGKSRNASDPSISLQAMTQEQPLRGE